MRVATYNIAGAYVAGRRQAPIQQRAWHHLAAFGVDLAFVQEAEEVAIPDWARAHWDLVVGEKGTFGKNYGWGSVIAADPTLKLRPREDLIAADPWLRLLYDYLVVGEIDLPDGRSALVASVHAVARTANAFLGDSDQSDRSVITNEDLAEIAQPGAEAWVQDIAFHALRRNLHEAPFIIGGDWNNARLFDRGRRGPPISAMFFTRAADYGWFECHQGNEERTWLRPDHRPLQLDHLFCDATTATALERCRVLAEWPVRELSDHAPLIADFTDQLVRQVD